MVGTAFTPRPAAKCNGIIQAVIEGQKRPFISDWPADNFVRWAQALGFIKWDKATDSFSITDAGLALSKSKKKSSEEYEIYENAFLSYPPVSRILHLLVEASEDNDSLTKFEIGKNLGFIGEEGFTSISQSLFVKEISLASKLEAREIKQNWEGDSDKYARMICSWLTQLKYKWVDKTEKIIKINSGDKNFSYKLQAYTITKKGFEIRKKALGISKFKKIPKIVSFEMLSTKAQDRTYLRTRRSYILSFISKSPHSALKIKEELQKKGFNETDSTIQDDIRGLENIGLTIKFSKNLYYCSDNIIGLKIPKLEVAETKKSDILELTEKCRSELVKIPHDYLVLIAMGFDKKQSILYEIKTIELLAEQCKFSGLHLGGANRPDGIIYDKDYGVIIDTKSYESGFNVPAPERDKMKRYIDENQMRNSKHNKTKWWENFPKDMREFLFLFVSGKFGGNFKDQLKILSERTNDTLGGVISSYALLKIADKVVAGNLNRQDFKDKISCLDEVEI